ncbi:isoaspartyl peptidase/L-asparaginase [Chloropicon roscoffensis]|uniref:beta-aspartyl-peptidase n=1 Tax=Chloropicon roscoffensis TaxID=1461544 RepID=A0AAX4PG86_9CHLO
MKKSIGMAALWAAIAIAIAILALPSLAAPSSGSVPGPIIVVNTWPFVNATAKAWSVLTGTGQGNKDDAVTAVVEGVSICENLQCDHTVGFGGSPDELAGVTLDALVMDGDTLDAGAAVALHSTRHAARAARLVMETTNHTMLAGKDADAFAASMGMPQSSLRTAWSESAWEDWKRADCQPNYRRNVSPDPRVSCGPYRPRGDTIRGSRSAATSPLGTYGRDNHDTIAMVARDATGSMAAATSTNGATHKVPGRLADSGVVGSGAYVDTEVGGCGATGDGDTMMRFVPCYQVVESMRRGMGPKEAAEEALSRIRSRHPTFQGALLALSKAGEVGAATNCMDFRYSVASGEHDGDVRVVEVPASVPCPQ